MGKNQAYKAMQRSRILGLAPPQLSPMRLKTECRTIGCFALIISTWGNISDEECLRWHAARLASLNTTHTITCEDYKNKQKEEEMKKGELEADTDKLMREYRAQLDAERALKLSKGRNTQNI
ncbi:hypothetical protein YC2023_111055 [Brassica napus]